MITEVKLSLDLRELVFTVHMIECGKVKWEDTYRIPTLGTLEKLLVGNISAIATRGSERVLIPKELFLVIVEDISRYIRPSFTQTSHCRKLVA